MKKTSHASPIILAVLCAVGVHTVLFTDAGHRMQGAITESSTEMNSSDASLTLNGDSISLLLQKDVLQVTQITASLIYNNESLSILEAESILGNITKESEDFSDVISIQLSSPKDIAKGTVLATWKITKVVPGIQTVNLSDMQIQSSHGIVSLSTRGTGEF